jgi:hypothetical protein
LIVVGRGPLSAEPQPPIRQFRTTFAFVSQLGDEKREWLDSAGDPRGAGVDRIETGVADEGGGEHLGAPVIAAVNEARLLFLG